MYNVNCMYQVIKLLTYFEMNHTFSELSLQSLKIIRKCAFTVIFLIMIAIVYLRVLAQFTGDDTAGPISLGLMRILATSIVATFVNVLQKQSKMSWMRDQKTINIFKNNVRHYYEDINQPHVFLRWQEKIQAESCYRIRMYLTAELMIIFW